MRLVRARIQNYRSIEDSGWVEIESDLTSLVGKNESGKTAFLQALFRLNPIEQATYDEIVDYPSRLTRQRKEHRGGDPGVHGRVRARRGRDLRHRGRARPWVPDVGDVPGLEGVPIEGFDVRRPQSQRGGGGTSPRRQHRPARRGWRRCPSCQLVRDLIDALSALPEPTAKSAEMLTWMTGWRDQRLNLHLIDEYLSPGLPKFVYFDEYSTMPGKVSIPRLIEERDSGVVDRGKRALLALLALVHGRPEDFNDHDRHEHLIRELENTANSISDEVFEYWSQNKDLQVQLSVMDAEPGAAAPLDRGPIFHIRVMNRRHRVSVSFDERSRGFVWFFSFLAYFSELEETNTNDLVLLLDEPGLALHATAQNDLLRYMEEKLAPEHQVIYTTHSPFMIYSEHLERARTVVDVDDDGTKISADVFHVDEETVFPLQAALGYTLAQTLFIGPKNLLLEGPSDLIYLEVMNDVLMEAGLDTIDDSWVLVPVGGAGKLSTFVSLIGANQLKLGVIMDSSTKDADAVKRLTESGRLDKGSLIQMSEIAGRASADIEDLSTRVLFGAGQSGLCRL